MKANLMNRVLPRMMLAGACAGLLLCPVLAQEKPAEPKSKPEAEKPVKSAAKVPFLGLALSSVDESLGAQIGLPEGVGVLVRAVQPDSPAGKAGVQQHDVLHYFNDQLLVNESQLQILVRQAGIGADVKLTLLRKGKSEIVNVKLGETEDRKAADVIRWRASEPSGPMRKPFQLAVPPGTSGKPGQVFMFEPNGDAFANQVRELQERLKDLQGKPEQMREAIERFQKEIQEQAKKASEGAAKQVGAAKQNAEVASSQAASIAVGQAKGGEGGIRVQVFTSDGKAGDGRGVVTATSDAKGNVVVTQSNTTRTNWTDADGSGEIVTENGRKKITVKDRDGKIIFTGPVDTDEQRTQLPAEARERLERIEENVKVEVRPAVRPKDD